MAYTRLRNNTLNANMETNKKYVVLKMGSYLTSTAGLGWYIMYTLGAIENAVQNDYIPVVDWRNCKLPHYDYKKVGIDNVWEYYFEQPFDVSLDTAYASEDYFIVDDVRNFGCNNIPNIELFYDFSNSKVKFWRELFREYIRFTSDVEEYFHLLMDEMKLVPEKMVGLLVRGTDYVELKPPMHAKAVGINIFFERIDKILLKEPDMKFFLATEDNGVFEKFHNRYRDNIVVINSIRYENIGNKTLNTIYKDVDAKERDKMYLFSLYVLSLCKSVFLSPCGGSMLVSMMKRKADNYNFFYQGKNEVTGVIIGSLLELKKGNLIMMGDKPLLFYSLNNMRLLNIKKVFLIVTEEVKIAYQKIIGNGFEYGLNIEYYVMQKYDFAEFVCMNEPSIFETRTLVMCADTFIHGKDIVKDIFNAMPFDGAYAWISEENQNLDEVSIKTEKGIVGYKFIGLYLFDYELYDIVHKIYDINQRCNLEDILNEYIRRRKLFINSYKKGILCVDLQKTQDIEELSNLICSYKNLTGFVIGNFEQFK